ncbi:MAG: MarC family protein [Candidatus Micrarchaeota archaeon]
MDFWEYFIVTLIPLLAIINPLSTIGVFLSLTRGMKKPDKHHIALLTSAVAFVILIFFALTGFWIFQVYSITIDAFRIAGGIALLAIGLNMLFPPKHEERHSSDFNSQIYIVPLAIPMTSGPGAITTTVILATNAPDLMHQIFFCIVILAACAINYVALRFSEHIDRLVGREGLTALVKIMGLIVCSIAVQFIVVGLKAVFPILAG